MKKKFNLDSILSLIFMLVAIVLEVILIIISIQKQRVAVSQYIIQCVNCILWIFSSIFAYIILNKKAGEGDD